MSISAIWLFLKSGAGKILAVALAVLAVVVRLKWLENARDNADRAAEIAKSEARVEKAARQINKSVQQKRAAAATEEQARRELEDEQARIDKAEGGPGRTGFESKW